MLVTIKKNFRAVTTQEFTSWYDAIKWIVDREQKSSIVPCLWEDVNDDIKFYIADSKENEVFDMVEYYESILTALERGYIVLENGDGDFAQFMIEELEYARDVNGVLRDARMSEYTVKEV